ncbi:basic proline-rich protein-like [Mauremys reevesii]|uniref:basic proline-rich protein-like n=1 Tax=Mauremys reevesii TaxID=260615 RepID=UPI00193F4402|nr:basic proline-rich protein-like [Mauremys reevesii]
MGERLSGSETRSHTPSPGRVPCQLHPEIKGAKAGLEHRARGVAGGSPEITGCGQSARRRRPEQPGGVCGTKGGAARIGGRDPAPRGVRAPQILRPGSCIPRRDRAPQILGPGRDREPRILHPLEGPCAPDPAPPGGSVRPGSCIPWRDREPRILRPQEGPCAPDPAPPGGTVSPGSCAPRRDRAPRILRPQGGPCAPDPAPRILRPGRDPAPRILRPQEGPCAPDPAPPGGTVRPGSCAPGGSRRPWRRPQVTMSSMDPLPPALPPAQKPTRITKARPPSWSRPSPAPRLDPPPGREQPPGNVRQMVGRFEPRVGGGPAPSPPPENGAQRPPQAPPGTELAPPRPRTAPWS